MVSNSSRTRCLFFGMPCAFSTIVLEALRGTDLELVGIVTPDKSALPGGPLSTPRPYLPLHAAGERRLDTTPRFAVQSLRDAAVQKTLIASEPDLIIVACFPWLIPAVLIDAASVAAVNVHPSLLPRWRGPEPLFWTFHAGDRISGSTLHLLEAGFDTGDILDQEQTSVHDGETLTDLERRLAILGGKMLADLARTLPSIPSAMAQDEARVTDAPIPDETARTIDSQWTIARARQFLGGIAESHGPLRYRDDDGTVHSIASFGRSDDADAIVLADGSLPTTLRSAT
jgi:methionyl-tRNA formyltransferase